MAIKKQVTEFVVIDPKVALMEVFDLAFVKWSNLVVTANPSFFQCFDWALRDLYPHVRQFTDSTAGLDPYDRENFADFLEWFLDGAEGVGYGD